MSTQAPPSLTTCPVQQPQGKAAKPGDEKQQALLLAMLDDPSGGGGAGGMTFLELLNESAADAAVAGAQV
ncbi:family exonuclease dinG family helicase [Micractinium conductrix]|uniref:Family exonuclease dinG family helicase n=1 Tax=Micractinium conductrix TaxID=554055 RepID=A0A2P6VKP6_9CHLO|nr:family exonuclease dinG family helicase [Micractinium conductrix]|eukprot:PSC74654.1 family exonuclease dinG family helicase [Micractinium conductrix]